MNLPIGYDDFREIIDNKLSIVDKSLFIKDILENASKVILITRPRRFGKTLNLSMLRYFLAPEVYGESTQGLFNGLYIQNEIELCKEHQGHYPAVFISFKDIKDHSFEVASKRLAKLMSEVYSEYRYLLSSDKLYEEDKKYFRTVLAEEFTNHADLESSLKNLTRYLHQHHSVKPWLLIDEYDTPIQSAYLNGYYEEMIGMMRGLFGAALKTNPYLFKAVLTGILRVSKESLFSGLNNIKVYTMLNPRYGNYFGFTDEEILTILKQSELSVPLDVIRSWYNGYQIGDSTVYNPWSIVNCVHDQGVLKPYWVNTSDNALIKQLLIKSTTEFKEQLELLLDDKPVEKIIDENFVYGDLITNHKSGAWSLLFMTGYLKAISSTETEQGFKCFLMIPNREVRTLYRQIVEQWLSNGHGIEFYNKFLADLLKGHLPGINAGLETIMQQTASSYDVSKEPEAFYHGLLLGLIASIDRNQYELKSNRESGLGRYDIAIIPRDTATPGIIIELKRYVKSEAQDKIDEILQQNATEALHQIEKRNYPSEFIARRIKNLIKMGLAFSGKQFKIVSEKVNLS